MAEDVIDLLVRVNGADFKLLKQFTEKPLNIVANVKVTLPPALSDVFRLAERKISVTVDASKAQAQLESLAKPLTKTVEVKVGRIGEGGAEKATASPGRGLLAAEGALFAFEDLKRAAATVAEVFSKVTEAGLTFERSILSVQSVLQATTTVRGAGGEALPFGEQLSFQEKQARQIQTAARARLLPLGISGSKEATLVQAIVAGAAQRGINLTADEAATLAERLGGAIGAQRPEVLENETLLRRDVEATLSGSSTGKRTAVGQIIGAFAPGLFKATTGEELVRQSAGLSSFPETLQGSNNPETAFRKLSSALDQLATSAGDALVKTLVPGLKSLTATLSDSKISQGIETFSRGIGKLSSFLLERGGRALDFVTKNLPASPEEQLQTAQGRLEDIQAGKVPFNPALGSRLRQEGALNAEAAELRRKIPLLQEERDKKRLEELQEDFKDRQKTVTPRSTQLLESINSQFGTTIGQGEGQDKDNPFLKLAAAEEARRTFSQREKASQEDIEKAVASQRNDSENKAFKLRSDLNIAQKRGGEPFLIKDLQAQLEAVERGIPDIPKNVRNDFLKTLRESDLDQRRLQLEGREGIFKARQSLFSKNLFGQQDENAFERKELPKLSSQAQDNFEAFNRKVQETGDALQKAQKAFDATKEGSKAQEESGRKLQEALKENAQAAQEASQSLQKLVSLRQEEEAAVDKQIAVQDELREARLRTINTRTFEGQAQALNLRREGLQSDSTLEGQRIAALQKSLPGLKGTERELAKEEISNRLLRQGEREQQAREVREQQKTLPVSTATAEVQAVQAITALRESAFNAAKETAAMAKSVREAGLALEDFQKEQRLRALERTDQEQALKVRAQEAQKAYLRAQGFDDETVESAFTSPETDVEKAARGRDLAQEQLEAFQRKNDPGRVLRSEEGEETALTFQKQGLEKAQKNLPFEQAGRKLQSIQSIVELSKNLPALKPFAQKALEALPETLKGLGQSSTGLDFSELFNKAPLQDQLEEAQKAFLPGASLQQKVDKDPLSSGLDLRKVFEGAKLPGQGPSEEEKRGREEELRKESEDLRTFRSQRTEGSGGLSSSGDVVNAIKSLPAAIGIQVRQALESSFS